MLSFGLNCAAGVFIMLAGAVLKVPIALVLLVITKAVSDPVSNTVAFINGVIHDSSGYIFAVWLAHYGINWMGVELSWILLLALCVIVPWLSWERMMNTSVLENIRWIEIGNNVGRVVGLIAGGILFL